jgi:hypothetical protein
MAKARCNDATWTNLLTRCSNHVIMYIQMAEARCNVDKFHAILPLPRVVHPASTAPMRRIFFSKTQFASPAPPGLRGQPLPSPVSGKCSVTRPPTPHPHPHTPISGRAAQKNAAAARGAEHTERATRHSPSFRACKQGAPEFQLLPS